MSATGHGRAPEYAEVIKAAEAATDRPTPQASTTPQATSAQMDFSDDVPPPPYIHTVYDETYRGIWYRSPSILSMAHRGNLIGYMEHPAPSTDGSFAICIANGEGTFLSEALYESIPKEHRPELDETDAGTHIDTLMNGTLVASGSILFPFLLTDMETGERMRYIVRALVVPKLFLGLFIGANGDTCVLRTEFIPPRSVKHQMKRLDGTCWVKGV